MHSLPIPSKLLNENTFHVSWCVQALQSNGICAYYYVNIVYIYMLIFIDSPECNEWVINVGLGELSNSSIALEVVTLVAATTSIPFSCFILAVPIHSCSRVLVLTSTPAEEFLAAPMRYCSRPHLLKSSLLFPCAIAHEHTCS